MLVGGNVGMGMNMEKDAWKTKRENEMCCKRIILGLRMEIVMKLWKNLLSR